MALRTSDLYSSLWKSCDELRGRMDASQYKDYMLMLLFVKYVSDKAKTDKNSLIEVPTGDTPSLTRGRSHSPRGADLTDLAARLRAPRRADRRGSTGWACWLRQPG